MTGLAAGITSGFQIFEKENIAGGISSSYYIDLDGKKSYTDIERNEEAYRFDIGGGHWIFGAGEEIKKFMSEFVSLKNYSRRSSVFFKDTESYIPYPIQNQLRYMKNEVIMKCLSELNKQKENFTTMKEWLEQTFGLTLCKLFFFPFHELYTAGLYETIAHEDSYKSPVDLPTIIQGSKEKVFSVGYNSTFAYPAEGLGALAQQISEKCNIMFNMKANKIDTRKKEVYFDNGLVVSYNKLISTLPLNKIIEISGITCNSKY